MAAQASIPRAARVQPAGSWSHADDVVVLTFDDRFRRRLTMTSVSGMRFLLDLSEARALRGGEALCLDDGRLIEIVAAAEPLIEVRAADASALARLCWHLGNRHLPVQFVGQRIRLRRDHVIEDMIRGLQGAIRVIEAPFDPEGGAYGSHATAHTHAHAHAHGGSVHHEH